MCLAAFVASLAVGYVRTARALAETEHARAETEKALSETHQEAAKNPATSHGDIAANTLANEIKRSLNMFMVPDIAL